MKRISLALLGVLLISTAAVAQLNNFNQPGKATHEMRGEGLVGNHPNLAIGTRVIVANTLTGKEIEVTIAGRIPASNNRIIDLSPGAWQELGLSENANDVRIRSVPQTRSRPVPAPEPTPEPAQLAQAPEEPKSDDTPQASETPKTDEPQQLASADDKRGGGDEPIGSYPPLNLIVNVNPSDRFRQGSDTEFLAWLATMMMDARDSRESREAREAREYREAARESREAREAREYRDATRDARDAREARDSRDAARESREAREAREYQEAAREARELREAREERYFRELQTQGSRDNINLTMLPVAGSAPQAVSTITNPAPVPVQPSPAAQAPAPAPRQAAPSVPPEPVRQVHVDPQPAIRGEIQIVPGLPDRFTGKKHDVQIGAYSAPEAAARVVQLVRGAGFEVGQEIQGSVYRILVMGIPAADVYPAIQRLASLGFRQFWVRD